MTILACLTLLAATLLLAYLLSHGLPETMRAAALWLLTHARQMDERRAKRDGGVRERLAEQCRKAEPDWGAI